MMPSSPYCVAIGGNLGSGKSSLAARFKSARGYSVVPQLHAEDEVIQKLFQNPQEWACRVQLMFLSLKARCLADAQANLTPFVVDRSMLEDVKIFCQYFFDLGYISEFDMRNYKAISSTFIDLLKPPDLYIICHAPVSVLEDRLKSRPRQYQTMYPRNHLNQLNFRYENFIKDMQSSPLFLIDTSKILIQTDEQLHDMLSRIRLFLNRIWSASDFGECCEVLRSIEQDFDGGLSFSEFFVQSKCSSNATRQRIFHILESCR